MAVKKRFEIFFTNSALIVERKWLPAPTEFQRNARCRFDFFWCLDTYAVRPAAWAVPRAGSSLRERRLWAHGGEEGRRLVRGEAECLVSEDRFAPLL
jgi:hypothetical protein